MYVSETVVSHVLLPAETPSMLGFISELNPALWVYASSERKEMACHSKEGIFW